MAALPNWFATKLIDLFPKEQKWENYAWGSLLQSCRALLLKECQTQKTVQQSMNSEKSGSLKGLCRQAHLVDPQSGRFFGGNVFPV